MVKLERRICNTTSESRPVFKRYLKHGQKLEIIDRAHLMKMIYPESPPIVKMVLNK